MSSSKQAVNPDSLSRGQRFQSEFRNGLSVIDTAAHIALRRMKEGNATEVEQLILVVRARVDEMAALVDQHAMDKP